MHELAPHAPGSMQQGNHQCKQFVNDRGVGSKDLRVSIELQVESDSPRFRLAQPLAQLTGKATATRRGAERALWTYLRDHSLLVRFCILALPGQKACS